MPHGYPFSLASLDPRLAPYGEDGLDQERIAALQECGPAVEVPWDPPPLRPGLTLIILTRDKPELILPLLSSLGRHQEEFSAAGLAFSVLVGDTGSTDPRVIEGYRSQPGWVRIISGLRYHFSRANNQVFASGADTEQVLFLNNDVVLEGAPGCLLALQQRMAADPGLGAQGAVLRFPDGGVQHAGIDLLRSGPLRLLCHHPHAHAVWPVRSGWSRRVPAVTGAFLQIPTRVFCRLGGFDGAYAAECQDADLCYQVRRLGLRVEVVDAGRILHLENATRPKGEEHWDDRRLLQRRWSALLSLEAE